MDLVSENIGEEWLVDGFANDLKTNRIKLPFESTYVFDVNRYPPKPLTRKWLGRQHDN